MWYICCSMCWSYTWRFCFLSFSISKKYLYSFFFFYVFFFLQFAGFKSTRNATMYTCCTWQHLQLSGTENINAFSDVLNVLKYYWSSKLKSQIFICPNISLAEVRLQYSVVILAYRALCLLTPSLLFLLHHISLALWKLKLQLWQLPWKCACINFETVSMVDSELPASTWMRRRRGSESCKVWTFCSVFPWQRSKLSLLLGTKWFGGKLQDKWESWDC